MGTRSYRVGIRFYVFIVLFIGAVGGLCFWLLSPKTDYIRYGSMSSGGFYDSVIIYDEQMITIPENDRLIYNAAEGDKVYQGQALADIYKKGYVVSAVKDLWELQKNIVLAQENDTIKDIYKPELVQYDLDIEKTLKSMQDYSEGDISYYRLDSELKRLMSERQEYIRENFSPGEAVKLLYTDEQERIAALSGWQETVLAPGPGYVSWYTDGLENTLKASELSKLTVPAIKQSRSQYITVNNRREGETAKIINAERFYIASVWDNADLPKTGSEAEIYISGIEGAFKGRVYDVINGREKAVIYEINQDVQKVLGLRAVEISVDSPISEGFIVPLNFIKLDKEKPYIYTNNEKGEKTAVYVRKLAQDNNYALVAAEEGGKLSLNAVIYNK